MAVEASWTDEVEAASAADVGEDRPTLPEVFDAHAPFVARALRCLGVSDREVPDACQEVFLVVHRRLDDYQRRGSMRSWLYAICLRQALRVRRRHARRREDAVSHPPEPPTDVPTPQEELEKSRRLELALHLLTELDDERRVVFVLYEVEQLPMAEVAEIVSCPLQTAYSRLYSARKHLARRIKQTKGRSPEKGAGR